MEKERDLWKLKKRLGEIERETLGNREIALGKVDRYFRKTRERERLGENGGRDLGEKERETWGKKKETHKGKRERI